MIKEITTFQKKKNFLICIDSDGCAIDGMTIKHKECFGPSIIEEWKLQPYEEKILSYWNHINLYTMSRGINRFKGLLLALHYIDESGYAKINTAALKDWVDTTKELSNKSLEQEIALKGDEVLKKALHWSNLVNEKVESLSPEKKLAFEGVKECLKEAIQYADIAVVSSANLQAVKEEWGLNHILDYVDVVMTQENGSKSACMKQMLTFGYENQNVLMIGDALGDINAAKDSDILYYPILANQEVYSWKKFKDTILELFLQNQYKEKWMKLCENEFVDNLLSNK